jgi:allophanate hydrolase
LSTRGVVPACRSLDCVSVFALTAEDASAVFHLTACFDPEDPLARMPSAAAVPRFPSRFRFGVPPGPDLEFFGDEEAARLFMAPVGLLEQAGGIRVETSFAPFRDAGRLLYQGPWLAERLHATEALLRENPGAMLPVTRAVIERGRRYSALDAYRAQYELAALRRATDRLFAAVDLLLLPTAGTVYEIAEVAAEPLRCNANLGLYTNFVNLLDLAAVALPGGFGKSGLPFGFSLIAPAYADRALLDLGTRCQRVAGLPPAARQSSTMVWPAGTTATTSG